MPCVCVGSSLSSVKLPEEGRLGPVLYSGVAVGSDSGVGATDSEQWLHKELRSSRTKCEEVGRCQPMGKKKGSEGLRAPH